MTFEEFIEKGDFILYKDYDNNYLWEDWNACKELTSENKDLFIYTVISEGSRCWVVEGIRWADRMGYLFSKKFVPIEDDLEY